MTKPRKAPTRHGTKASTRRSPGAKGEAVTQNKTGTKTSESAKAVLESAAASAIARTWLAKVGLASPESLQIDGTYFDYINEMYVVNVRIYIPQLDIDAVIDGDHIDGITLENAP
jgi:hypothetical protein